MSSERIDFNNQNHINDMMMFCEHFSRYALLRSYIKDKVVLDIACGEGYGSYMLKKWGAKRVIGVDISQQAINAATKHFSHPDISFICENAQTYLGSLNANDLDVIVSFETIEHLENPQAFLDGLKKLQKQETLIFISCPNDYVAMSDHESNPYHLHKYTINDFKLETENTLGKASYWMLGANTQGYVVVEESNTTFTPIVDLCQVVEQNLIAETILLPTNMTQTARSNNVLFYLGVWGDIKHPPKHACNTLISYSAFIEPWKELEWIKPENARLANKVSELKQQLDEEKQRNIVLNRQMVKVRANSLGVVSPKEARLIEIKRNFLAKKWVFKPVFLVYLVTRQVYRSVKKILGA